MKYFLRTEKGTRYIGDRHRVDGVMAFYHDQSKAKVDTWIYKYDTPMSLPTVLVKPLQEYGTKRVYVRGNDGRGWMTDLKTIVLEGELDSLSYEDQYFLPVDKWTEVEWDKLQVQRIGGSMMLDEGGWR